MAVIKQNHPTIKGDNRANSTMAWLSRTLHKQMRIRAANDNKFMQQVFEEAVTMYLAARPPRR